MPARYDFSRLPTKGRRTSQGFLRVDGHPTRVGVFNYRRADGTTVRELRPPDEVFREDSLASLRGAPVTDLHPPEMVKPTNVRSYGVGHVGDDVRRDGDGVHVAASMTVVDAHMIDGVERRDRVELSCGYDCAIEVASGRFDGSLYGPHVTTGEPYDAIQRRIVYNHVALGPENWGRQGKDVRLKLDAKGDLDLGAEGAVLEECFDASGSPEPPVSYVSHPPSPGARKPMDLITIRIDGVDYEIPKALAPHVGKALLVRDEQITQLTSERDKAAGRADGLEKDVADGKKKITELEDPKRLDSLVAARTAVVAAAAKVLDKDYKYDGLTDRQVREAVLKKLDDKLDLTGKSDDYVSARFDAETADEKVTKRTTDRNDSARRALNDKSDRSAGARKDDKDAADKRRQDAEEQRTRAWAHTW